MRKLILIVAMSLLASEAHAGGSRSLWRLPGDPLAEIGDGAGIRLHGPTHDADKGRLACAILAEKGVDLARLHGEIDLVQGFYAGILLLDLAEFDNRTGHYPTLKTIKSHPGARPWTHTRLSWEAHFG